MASEDSRLRPITVVLPPEPPELTPGAARALLRILVKAHEKQTEQQEAGAPSSAQPPTGYLRVPGYAPRASTSGPGGQRVAKPWNCRSRPACPSWGSFAREPMLDCQPVEVTRYVIPGDRVEILYVL
jgi:hypothetical protein